MYRLHNIHVHILSKHYMHIGSVPVVTACCSCEFDFIYIDWRQVYMETRTSSMYSYKE